MDYSDVKKLLPHRDPFLFIDKVISVSKDGITAERYVSPEEPFFKGTFQTFLLCLES